MIYLVTESSNDLEKILRYSLIAIDQNIEYLQIRNKVVSYDELKNLAKEIIKHKKNTKIIINDHFELATEIGADGVHVGQSDMRTSEVRKIIGDKIIGLSVENYSDAVAANLLPINYIAASPVFTTKTKTDAAPPVGIDGLKEIKAVSKHPVFAIGGINISNAKELLTTGADGLCFVSEIYSASDPAKKIKSIQKIIKGDF